MTNDLKYPTITATISILEKIGVNPSTRFDEYDQDYEYTSCRLEELEEYLVLYEKKDTSDQEKRVLGCFLLECNNEYIWLNNSTHFTFDKVMNLLHNDINIHENELAYWSNTEDSNEENWWGIARFILDWRIRYKQSTSSK